MKHRQTLAIVGSGPSCIYLLKHLLDAVEFFRERFSAIEVFEKRHTAGMGMPYNPETTERFNMSNISSEELPELTISFAEWLRSLDPTRAEELGIDPGNISEREVYSRLALGEYLHAQYHSIISGLASAGIAVREHSNCKIVDVREEARGVILFEDGGAKFEFDRVVVATGHYWPEDDHPESGYFVSPWPISKLLPKRGETFNFTIGTLGASLSAFDVVASLAHRHGTFKANGEMLSFHPDPGTEEFKIAMHSADGLLPHLQYGQAKPLRKIERHVSEEELLAMRDGDGHLRLSTYFDKVCRCVLKDAFQKDGMPELVSLLGDPAFGIVEFAEKMTEKHDYSDAFKGMRKEMAEAEKSLEEGCPIHWKEAIDDLMYTLNFYAEMLPAEDHLTLHAKFLPFLMNVIAALPLPSGRTLLALHDAGKLELISGKVKVEDANAGDTRTRVTIDDGDEASEIWYRMFINCAGQRPLGVDDYPFPTLVKAGGIREARAPFIEPDAAKKLPSEEQEKIWEDEGRKFFPIGGVDIDRGYRLVGKDGRSSEKVFDIAFPHTSGERPYSYGLQACNDTARIVVKGWIGDSRKMISAEQD